MCPIRFAKGYRVTAPFILGCGACPTCLSDDATCCDTQDVIGFTHPGAFPELIAIPRADFNLVPLPEPVKYAAAAGMVCRVTTAFKAVVDRGAVQPGNGWWCMAAAVSSQADSQHSLK